MAECERCQKLAQQVETLQAHPIECSDPRYHEEGDAQRIATLEAKVEALTKERDTLEREIDSLTRPRP